MTPVVSDVPAPDVPFTVARTGFDFAVIHDEVVFDPGLSDAAVRLYAALERYDGDAADPGLRGIQHRLGWDDIALAAALTELRQAELIG